jgi:Domain of unknown function (DUF222)
MFDTDLLAEVAQLHASAARVAAAIDSGTSGPVADELLSELLEVGRQVDLGICRSIERVDRSGQFAADGAASSTGYLRRKVNERGEWAAKRVAAGRALADRLPMAAKCWEAGRLGLEHVSVIDQATRQLEDPLLVGEIDRILSEAAGNGLDPTDLARLADQLRAQSLPEAAEQKAKRQYRDQRLHASTSLGGMVHVSGWLDPEAGAAFQHALGLFTPKPPPADEVLAEPGYAQPIAFRRALGLHQLVRHALAHAEGCHGEGGTRDAMIIGVGLDTLKTGLGVGAVAGGPSLSAGTLRRLACDADIIPAVLGTNSEILDLGRRQRLANAALRAAVIARDGGCIFPGCQRPPSWCECHHRHHWLDGGKTSLQNLDLLCSHHHHLLHEGGWRLTLDHDAARTPWFHPPNGNTPLQGQRRPLIPRQYRT